MANEDPRNSTPARDASSRESGKPAGNRRFTNLRRRFFAGFAVAIPLIVTVWLFVLVYRFILFAGRPVIQGVCDLLNWSLGRTEAANNLFEPAPWLLNVLGILVPIVIFIVLGSMATNVIGRRVLALMDQLMLKFPVVSFIYSAIKQVISSFRDFGSGRNFKRVAYVEYPSPGCRLIGFVTGQYFDSQVDRGVTSIFIPTSPNPMTGFVIVVDDDKVFDSSLSIEEASKLILSAGLVSPVGETARKEITESLDEKKNPEETTGAKPHHTGSLDRAWNAANLGKPAESASSPAATSKTETPNEKIESERVSAVEEPSEADAEANIALEADSDSEAETDTKPEPVAIESLPDTFGGLTGYENDRY